MSAVLQFRGGLWQGWLLQRSFQALLCLKHTLISTVEHGQVSVKAAPKRLGGTPVINQFKSGVEVLSEVHAGDCGLPGIKEKTEGLVWCLVDWYLFYGKSMLKWLIIQQRDSRM